MAASGGGYGRSRNQCVLASQLREFYVSKVGRTVEMRVSVHLLGESKSRLVDALRTVLGRFIDPNAHRIRHAMPVTEGESILGEHRANGLVDREFVPSLQSFADALVQAAVAGVEETVQMLADWIGGKLVMFCECTVLNDVHLTATVSPTEEIHLVPLGLTTTELPAWTGESTTSGLPIRRPTRTTMIAKTGTIPAWAGEPGAVRTPPALTADHPRVGGGTASGSSGHLNHSGPSPRGRGNR